MLEARQTAELAQAVTDGGRLAFQSGGTWAVFQYNDDWRYVMPASAHRWQRLLIWSPETKRAELWLTRRNGEPDPLGQLAFPFFSAFFAQHRGILLTELRGWVLRARPGRGGTGLARAWKRCSWGKIALSCVELAIKSGPLGRHGTGQGRCARQGVRL